MPGFILKTFGCKTNQYESEGIREALITAGWSETEKSAVAEAAIINTCSVTSRAGASARNAIRKLLKSNPALRIILTGCAVDIDEEWLRQLDIEECFKNTEKHLIAEYLQSSQTAVKEKKAGDGFEFMLKAFQGHTRAFLKIHDGCDNFCSYCIIPYARGLPRSRELADIIKEAATLANNGYHELVLTGINIGAYANNGAELPELLTELSHIPELRRIRLGSIEPIYLNDSLLETIKCNPKICQHLHLPLQSGSNSTLRAMNRKYTKEEFIELVEKARQILDNPAITTDIIVGFPAEDNESFRETLQTVELIGFARSHIFLFSPREGTPAALLKRPPQREADKHRLILEALTARQARAYSESLIGHKGEEIMIEKIEGNRAYGYLQRYIRAELEFGADTPIIKSSTYRVDITALKSSNLSLPDNSENTLLCVLNTSN